MLTTEQAAEIKGVSIARIKQYIASGLKASKFGRQWMIAEADLAAFKPKPTGRPRKT